MNKYKSPLIYPLRVAKLLYKLPKYIKFFEDKHRQHEIQLASSQEIINHLKSELDVIHSVIEKNSQDLTVLPSIDARIINLQDRIKSLKAPKGSTVEVLSVANNTVADNHDFDYFYKLFEDKFRGPEDTIKERVAEHLPLFTGLTPKLRKLPIVDIGCGRGEFLSLLKENKLHGIGVDMNKSMVDRAKKIGLNAIENDALTYLSSKGSSELAAITGFHIVEHIPFEVLMQIFEESHRTIAPGGFALFETPNPEALYVGANTFYLDPSHQRPIPSALLAFMLESVGFKSEIIPLHRVKPVISTSNKDLSQIHDTLFGYGDYAVVARKLG